nr:disease resistance protein RGA5-like [Oryza sativa Japonica Group]
MVATTAIVGATTGVMKPLLSKLTKLLGEEYAKLKGVRKQIKFLIDELSTMSAALEMLADSDQQLNPEMRDWRDKLRELAYDLEDCIDDFMSRVDHDGEKMGFRKFFRKLKKLKARHEIANEIEELKIRAIEASERHKRYNFDQLAHNSSTFGIDPRLSAFYEEVDKLVGIDGPKKRIIELLAMEMKGSLKVVSIVGCGGLGKTTLTNQVYDTIRSQFSCAAFVSVSQRPDIKKILNDIAEGVGISSRTPVGNDEKKLINILREHLKNKRYLVVIDDLWDAKAWKTIELALLNSNCGSRVITTTRSVAVASCCSSQDGYIYEMKPLSFDDSKWLFLKRAFGYEKSHYPHLEDVLDKILGKCGGLPLAIITISSLLSYQHAIDEWHRVLNDIGYGLARDPYAETMSNILSLSFFNLPHHLKTCFMYLSVFPEDYNIDKRRLVSKWIAEGFIQDEQGRSAYRTGELYFNELINRSLIEPVDVKYGQAKACRVHDIILDYIKCKATEENFVTSLGSTVPGCTTEYKVRRLSVINSNEEDVNIPTSLDLSQVRSLTIFGNRMQTSVFDFKFLRVLDLVYRDRMGDLFANIEKLFHLKYMCISSYGVDYLPEKIGELKYLETLDIRQTNVEILPSTITNLQRLARLFINQDTRFSDETTIGQLKSLEELKEFVVSQSEQVTALQEVSKLTKLRTLKLTLQSPLSLDDYHSCVGTLLQSLCNLYDLCIMDQSYENYCLTLDSWHIASPCSLRKLVIKLVLTKVPNWMGVLGNIGVLVLGILCIAPDDIEILGAIPSLLFLELQTYGGTNGRIIIHGNNRFISLKYFSLVIHACGTALEFEAGSMPKVEHLKLQFHLHELECLNGSSDSGIQHLSALGKVEVKIICKPSYVIELNGLNYDLMEQKSDCIVRCVARTIKTAVETLPNHPTISFKTYHVEECEHFETVSSPSELQALILFTVSHMLDHPNKQFRCYSDAHFYVPCFF